MALEIVVAVTATFMPERLNPIESNKGRSPKFSCRIFSRRTASYWPSAKYEAKNHQIFANIERLTPNL